MKKYKALLVAAAVTMLVSAAALCTVAVSAEQASGNIDLSFTPPGDPSAKYDMKVEIVGNGSIFDGTSELSTGVVTFQLPAEQEKTFRVQPQPGSKLESIVYDNVIITDKVDGNGYFTVKSKTYDTKLVVTFQGGAAAGNVKTGDVTGSIAIAATLTLLLSGTGVIVLVRSKRRINKAQQDETPK